MGIIWDQTQKFAHHDFTTDDCKTFIRHAIEHRSAPVEYDDFGYVENWHPDINTQDEFGSTVLMVCGKINRDNFSRTEAAKHLIDAGADVNLKDKFGRTALMRSLRSDFTDLLIKHGADVNILDNNLSTALHPYEFYNSSYDPIIVDLLIKAGADVNHRNDVGMTALMCSLSFELSDQLIKHGADVNIKDDKGCSALQHIIRMASSQKLVETELMKLVNLFIKNGANVDEILNSRTLDIQPKIKSYLENQLLIKCARASAPKITNNQTNNQRTRL